MREAKFILPLTAGQGAGHEYARQALLNAFGGYTFHKVEGAWRDHQGEVEIDQSVQYVVAIPHEAFTHFKAIALQAGRLEQQAAMYIVSPTGEADIVHLPHQAPAASDKAAELALQYGSGKPDRIVRPDPEAALTPHQRSIMHRPDKNNGENLPVQAGDLWLTADKSLVRITDRKMLGRAYGAIVESASPDNSVSSSVAYWDGKVEMMADAPHPLHLVKLLHRR